VKGKKGKGIEGS